MTHKRIRYGWHQMPEALDKLVAAGAAIVAVNMLLPREGGLHYYEVIAAYPNHAPAAPASGATPGPAARRGDEAEGQREP